MEKGKFAENCILVNATHVIVVFLCILASPSYTQTNNFKETEKRSYELFLSQQWDSLIVFNDRQISAGNDYFYLRTRSGIAYYSKNNYRDAVFHLEKAYRYNSLDSVNSKYLYLAYINSGRYQEAWQLEKKNRKQLKFISNQIKPGYYKSYIDGGAISSNNFSKNSQKNQMRRDSIYAEKDLYGSLYYTDILFTRPVCPSTHITIGGGYLVAQKRKIAQYHTIEKSGYDTILIDPGYYLDTLYSKEIKTYRQDYPLNQFQFYVSPSILLGESYILVAGISMLKTSYRAFNTTYSIEKYFAQSYDTIPSEKTVYNFPELDTTFINFSGSIGLYKEIRKFQAGLTGGFSGINNKNQYYSSLTLNYYPEGNLNSFLLGELILFNERSETNLVFQLNAGKKILKKTWVDLSFTRGKMKNFTEKNAYLVYNSGDETYLKAGSGILYSFNPKLSLHIRVQAIFNKGILLSVNSDNTFNNYQYNYQNINITGGLLWKI